MTAVEEQFRPGAGLRMIASAVDTYKRVFAEGRAAQLLSRVGVGGPREVWAAALSDSQVRRARSVNCRRGQAEVHQGPMCRQAIDRVLKAYPNAKLQDSTEFKDSQAAQINQLLGLIYVMLLLAVIIALIGIANTLALSIYERTRELGLLRAVGMSRRQLRSSIRWESVIISLLGTILGLVIGLFFGWAVVEALKDQGFTKFAAPGGQARGRRRPGERSAGTRGRAR